MSAALKLSDDLRLALDPVSFAIAIGKTPDPIQARVLRTKSSRWILCCTRQWGKSTTTAIRAAHRAIYQPNSLILCVSPTDRQSGLLFDKIAKVIRDAPSAPKRHEDNKRSLELHNGSRIVALPGSPDTIRGYSAPDMVLIDEAAYCEDALFGAVTPMLATKPHAELGLLSSPYGKRGSYYEAWASSDPIWERIKVTATECPRIANDFLEHERRSNPDWLFRQEYLCEFTDTIDSVFSTEQIEAAMCDGEELKVA